MGTEVSSGKGRNVPVLKTSQVSYVSLNLETTLSVRAALLYPSRLTSLIFSLSQENVNPDSNSNNKKKEFKKNTNSPFSNYFF